MCPITAKKDKSIINFTNNETGKQARFDLKKGKTEIPLALDDGDECFRSIIMNNKWKSKNRHKTLLQYHIIFVCKYRKKLLINKDISNSIKQLSFEICNKNNVIIHEMETDKDHIHYMIESSPTLCISKIVNLIKSYTTYHIWKMYNLYLSNHFWKENTFWTDGYFACSIGNVSENQLRKYIENQG